MSQVKVASQGNRIWELESALIIPTLSFSRSSFSRIPSESLGIPAWDLAGARIKLVLSVCKPRETSLANKSTTWSHRLMSNGLAARWVEFKGIRELREGLFLEVLTWVCCTKVVPTRQEEIVVWKVNDLVSTNWYMNNNGDFKRKLIQKLSDKCTKPFDQYIHLLFKLEKSIDNE